MRTRQRRCFRDPCVKTMSACLPARPYPAFAGRMPRGTDSLCQARSTAYGRERSVILHQQFLNTQYYPSQHARTTGTTGTMRQHLIAP